MLRFPGWGERGTVAVEFALVASVLILLLFGTIELGFALQTRLALGAAAREGARQAAVDGGVSPRVQQRIVDHLLTANIREEDTEVGISPRTASYGTPVSVTIAYDYFFRTPLLRPVLGSSVRLETRAISRSEKLR